MAALNVKTGKVLHRLGPSRTAQDLVAFMESVAANYHEAKKVIVIWDNLTIDLEGEGHRWLPSTPDTATASSSATHRCTRRG